MERIGLQMYTMRDVVGNPEEYKRTLERVAEMGYTVLQMTRPSFLSAEDNAELLRSLGLCADSVFRPWDSVISDISEAAREAEIFGCDTVRTNSIPDHLVKKGEEGYKEFAKIMNDSARACHSHGLRYSYHFHAFEWIRFGKRRGIDILLEETDPETVFFCPDVFWLTNAGTEPSSSLRLFKGRANAIHVKDYAIRTLDGVIESVPYFFAPVGEGNLNWEGIMKTAREIGIRDFLVEQDVCDGDVFDAIRTSCEALKTMLGK